MAPVGQYLRYSDGVRRGGQPARARARRRRCDATRPDGVREIYPGYGSVYVEWDDARAAERRRDARGSTRRSSRPPSELGEPRDIEVPVRYGGPDTDDVAETTGLGRRGDRRDPRRGRLPRVRPGDGGPADARRHRRAPAGPAPRRPARRRARRWRWRSPAASRRSTRLLLPGGWNVIGTALQQRLRPARATTRSCSRSATACAFVAAGRRAAGRRRRCASCCRPSRGSPALRVEQAGAFDLVLDGGRLNQAHRGMAQSGPLDAPAARLANALCGNPPGTTLHRVRRSTGPTLVALRDLVVGAAGRGMHAARRRRAGRPGARRPSARGSGSRCVATGAGRARLPRAGRRDRGRAVPRLGQRRPLRPARPAAAGRRRARPGARAEHPPRRDAGAARPTRRRTPSSACTAGPQWSAGGRATR